MENKHSFNCTPKMRKILFFVFLILTIAVMIIIFSLSAETAEESTDTSKGLSLSIINLFYPNFKTLSAELQAQIIGTYNTVFRILGHFCAFAALSFCSCGTVFASNIKQNTIKKCLIAASFSFTYAMFDETHQCFVPGRSFQVFDIAVDSFGIFTGIMVLLLITVLFNLFRQKYKK